ncbi:MAG TPA: hypothetical protein VEB64_04835, partial [Azospirillaceae bacterium]|nr:hypothetical protein [Azospirillaceae bacterium]
GPADYWQAASIGQLWRMLAGDAAPPDHLRLVAAMDHCLPAAYAGQCPGIDPRDVFERDLINVAGAPGGHGDPEYIRRLINEASARIAICPVIDMAGQAVYDGRDLPPTPPGYSAEALAVTKATCRDGVALLACAADADGRRKLTLGGACHPATVEHFMTVWAPAHGLTGIYGVPARGYAGGYLSD